MTGDYYRTQGVIKKKHNLWFKTNYADAGKEAFRYESSAKAHHVFIIANHPFIISTV